MQHNARNSRCCLASSRLLQLSAHTRSPLHVATEWARKLRARKLSLHLCTTSRMQQEVCSAATVQRLDGVRFALAEGRKRNQGVFRLSVCTPCATCGATRRRSGTIPACIRAAFHVLCLRTHVARLCQATGSAYACCPILDYSNSMLCYLEVARGKVEQLRSCAALNLLYTLALTQAPIYCTLSFNPLSFTHAVSTKTKHENKMHSVYMRGCP